MTRARCPTCLPTSSLRRCRNLAARASLLADRFFASPSRQLDVIGVTGTNGKTTCAWLLAQALTACDHPTAYLGTLGATFAGHAVAGELTTPDAVTVQRQLAGFAAQGARGVAMEVSSHALAQQRVAAVHFDAAVFTNLTRDHLDFHGDMASYGAAKASLFERDDIRLRVFNVDDASARAGGAAAVQRTHCLHARTGARCAVLRRSLRARALDCIYGRRAPASSWTPASAAPSVETPLIGSFNVDNVLAVLAVLLGSNLPLAKCVAALRDTGCAQRAGSKPSRALACRWWWWIPRTRRMRCRRRCRCCASIAAAA